MKNFIFNIIIIQLLLNFGNECYEIIKCIDGSSSSKKPSGVKQFFKKIKNKYDKFKESYKKSYNLKERDVEGSYRLEAHYNINQELEKKFKWKLFYSYFNKGKSLCHYLKLKRRYKKKYESETFSFKNYFSDVNIVFSQFKAQYTDVIFNVELFGNNKVVVHYDLKISDKIARYLTNVIKLTVFKHNPKPPSWKLKFNFLNGKKKLVIAVPTDVPGLFFTFYYEIIAFRNYFSSPFSLYGDIYFKFDNSFRRYKAGYFSIKRL
ncbi:conserved Plasmodium protein, unknown function [Plasmodium relictum]|uniref:Fam-a protein n=1 Tax=Plasmodium relictum TaxID=85471 RepID=A0A1J1HAQ1_PLARL|nr:conserved Plasmodium protein, unknown function [Plasmodium relictum]CRH01585.1 conserved Plasmodium protein, unknown function [Plasmodium relictum]